jgi:hypothetical protein
VHERNAIMTFEAKSEQKKQVSNNLNRCCEKNDEPNTITYAVMESVEKDEEMHGPFDSVSDLMEALNS